LGIVTQEVVDLRDKFGLPGLRVLQFAFDGNPDNPHLPVNYPPDCVAYTGTHDNDTIRGWFDKLIKESRTNRRAEFETLLCLLGAAGKNIHWDLIALVFSSRANTAMVQMQDLLGLGSQATMNRPGYGSGNWEWRLRNDYQKNDLAGRLKELTELCGRADSLE